MEQFPCTNQNFTYQFTQYLISLFFMFTSMLLIAFIGLIHFHISIITYGTISMHKSKLYIPIHPILDFFILYVHIHVFNCFHRFDHFHISIITYGTISMHKSKLYIPIHPILDFFILYVHIHVFNCCHSFDSFPFINYDL